jgi:hypothetical protein
MATKFYLIVCSDTNQPGAVGFEQWVKNALKLEKVERINALALIVWSDKSAKEISKILGNDGQLNQFGLIGVFSLNYPFAISPDTTALSAFLNRAAIEGLYRAWHLEDDPDANP